MHFPDDHRHLWPRDVGRQLPRQDVPELHRGEAPDTADGGSARVGRGVGGAAAAGSARAAVAVWVGGAGRAAARAARAAGGRVPPGGGVACRAGPKTMARTSRRAIVRSRPCTSITRPLGVAPLTVPSTFSPVTSSTTSAADDGAQAAAQTTRTTARVTSVRPAGTGMSLGSVGGTPAPALKRPLAPRATL